MAYIRPAGTTINDTWQGHKNRHPASKEPGIDYRAVVGTTVVSPADGEVIATHDSPSGKAGRWLLLRTGNDWHRALHLSKILVFSGKVKKGVAIAKSGASCDNDENGIGQHLHWTFWSNLGNTRPIPGTTPTDDFEAFLNSPGIAGLSGIGLDEEDEMFTDADRALLRQIKTQLANTHAGIWAGGRVKLGGSIQKFNLGVLPLVAQNQELIRKQAGEIEALKAIVEQLTTQQNVLIDVAPVNAARDRGILEASNGFIPDEAVVLDPIQDPGIELPLEGEADPLDAGIDVVEEGADEPGVLN